MTIVSVGLSHRITPVELLEKLVVPSAQLDDVLARLCGTPPIDEVVVLSTCNRLEVYAATRGPVAEVTGAVADLMAARGPVPVGEYLRTARTRVDAAAVEHLFTVACGLDSMAVGEDQIVAQLRAATHAATEAGTAGPVLTRLIDAALRASKRARTRTRIGSAGISLARTGLGLAGEALGGLEGRHALVLGTGGAGKLAVRLLHQAGVGRLSVAGRNEPATTRLAASVGGTPLGADDVPTALADTDLLVTATGCPAPLVLAEQVRAARSAASSRPMFVLDLGMPPDVESEVGRLAGVTLVDIAALGRHLAEARRPDDMPVVRAIIAQEVAACVDAQRAAESGPIIGAMRARVDALAASEMVRLSGRLPDLTEQHRVETEAAVHRILRKFLHGPTVRARELAADPDGRLYVEALRRLFDPAGSEAIR
ncbi:glutamyl-tRNA reductase [Blastococcus jejuensis]|uniref:Glutamyl-tRNA reductase n=1 Tax=Blastococcus jejuensis TaxID=351224 RepID=A0ABP6P1W7_9ACTN